MGVTRLGNAPGTDGDGRVSSPSARRQSDVSNTQEKDEALSAARWAKQQALAQAAEQERIAERERRLYRSKQGCTAANKAVPQQKAGAGRQSKQKAATKAAAKATAA